MLTSQWWRNPFSGALSNSNGEGIRKVNGVGQRGEKGMEEGDFGELALQGPGSQVGMEGRKRAESRATQSSVLGGSYRAAQSEEQGEGAAS